MGFDAERFFKDVDQRRRDRELSWRQLGRNLGVSASTFSRMSQGKRPDVDTFLTLLAWLEAPADAYIDGVDRPATSADTMTQVLMALRADASLAPDAADALEEIVRVAYRRLSQPN